MPPLDIIVTTYNGAHHLNDCLRSIRNQSYRDFQVLVIDNASTDDTAEAMADWLDRDPRIRYYRNEQNVGHIASANIAYRMTSAEYVLQMHVDDVLHPDFLTEVLANGLARHPECAFGYSLFYRLINGVAVEGTHQYRPNLPTGVQQVMGPLCFTSWIIQSFAVFRRANFDAVGGFDRHISRFWGNDSVSLRGGFVDHYMWARLATTGPAYVVDAPLGYYRIHEKSQFTQTAERRRLIQEAIRTYDYIYDDHDLFDDVTRYLVKVNEVGRLLTDNGLVKTAIDMLASTETGPEINPLRKGFLTALHDAMRVMIFDSPKWRDHYQMEPTATLDALAATLETLPPDTMPEKRRAPMGGRAS